LREQEKENKKERAQKYNKESTKFLKIMCMTKNEKFISTTLLAIKTILIRIRATKHPKTVH